MNQDFWNSSLQDLLHLPILNNSFDQAEVIELLKIKPYQLRFWESEFDCIRKNAETFQLHYSTHDLKILLRVKKYLMEDQLTIEKAKALIDSELKVVEQSEKQEPLQSIIEFQNELQNDLLATSMSNSTIEESMNMNAIYEEMSMETFKQIEPVHPKVTEFDHQQVVLKNAISKIREKLKNWGR